MAESTGLLNLHTGNRITSSNLVLSATQGQRFPPALIVICPSVKNAVPDSEIVRHSVLGPRRASLSLNRSVTELVEVIE